MKPEHFIYKSDGLYYMQNMPVKSDYENVGRTSEGDICDYMDSHGREQYEQALERAKEEAHIQCPKDGDLFRKVLIAHGMFQEGNIYTINIEEKIEVYDMEFTSCEHCISCLLIPNCTTLAARIVAPKKEEESELTQDELNALSSVGIIAKNWYAVSYSKNQTPFAIFESIEYARAYRDKFSATSIVEPWPMVIKDLRKK